ncbi:hypothetical protein AWB70_02611 [Caballeronia cordobensis]|uniref:Uncharacterized protein n=1 Tax=Caballeronia cordobensis TaxID=1353886 RepID=A0A158GXW2_CABCO|nr:hypothetical protein [Caballeronia cordobensis]SAL36697.1 hypothetical protein AWB70_02611 [Caballeronia cordobensis]
MAFPEWGRSFNALYVPLSGGFGWQCTLMTRREFHQIDWFMWRTHPYGDLSYEERGIKEKEQQRQIEQDRRDFDRLFRARIDPRRAYLSTEFRRYVDFIRHELRVSSWDIPVDGDGITRVLRRAVQDGRLVPAINRKRYWWSGQEVYKWYAPQYWPKPGGVSFKAKSDEVLDLRAFASGAGGAIKSGGGGSGFDWLGAAEAVAEAVLGSAGPDDSSGDPMLKGLGDTGDSDSLLSDAQPFEYQPDVPSDEMQTAWLPSTGGPPNSWLENPSGKKQWRYYDGNGDAAFDIDFGHDHGFGTPHSHNWENGKRDQGNPVSIF